MNAFFGITKIAVIRFKTVMATFPPPIYTPADEWNTPPYRNARKYTGRGPEREAVWEGINHWSAKLLLIAVTT